MSMLHDRFNPRSDQIPPVRIKGFTRLSLAQLFGELGLTRGVEVGVAEGIYSLVLCQNIPGLQLCAVDLWDTYYRDMHKLKDKAMQDEAISLAHEKLDPFGVTFIRKSSMDAVREFKNESLDFVYIDGDHSFDFVMQDLIEWSKKVKPGGIVSGHDAYRFRGAGVVDAVSAYTHCHQINEWFVCDEREVSFFWERP